MIRSDWRASTDRNVSAGLDVPAGTVCHLAHRHRGFADGGGDVVMAEAEHLTQDEDGPFIRAQRLEHDQHRD